MGFDGVNIVLLGRGSGFERQFTALDLIGCFVAGGLDLLGFKAADVRLTSGLMFITVGLRAPVGVLSFTPGRGFRVSLWFESDSGFFRHISTIPFQ
jgi:hypothetical protein